MLNYSLNNIIIYINIYIHTNMYIYIIYIYIYVQRRRLFKNLTQGKGILLTSSPNPDLRYLKPF